MTFRFVAGTCLGIRISVVLCAGKQKRCRYVLGHKNQQKITLFFSCNPFGVCGKMQSQDKTFLPWSFSICIEHLCISGRNDLAVHIDLFLIYARYPVAWLLVQSWANLTHVLIHVPMVFLHPQHTICFKMATSHQI